MRPETYRTDQEAIPHRPEADRFDFLTALVRLLEVARAYWWAIAVTPILFLIGIFAYVKLFPPVYRAEVLIMAEAKDDSSRENFYMFWNTFRKNDLLSEIELMRSNGVLSRVIRELNLGYDEVYHPVTSHLAYLWTESLVGRAYRSVKRTIFPPAPSPYTPTDAEIEFARTLNDFRTGISLVPVPDSSVGRIVLAGPSPRVAEIANHLSEVYIDERRRRFTEEAENAYRTLSTEVEKVRLQIAELEHAYNEFKVDHGLLLDLEQDKVTLAKWLELAAVIRESEANMVGLAGKRAELARFLAAEPQQIIAQQVLQKNPALVELEDNLHKLRQSLELQSLRFQEDAPELRDLRRQIAALETLRAGTSEKTNISDTRVPNSAFETTRLSIHSIDAELADIRAQLEVHRRVYEEIGAKLQTLPRDMSRNRDFVREFSVADKKYSLLKERLMMAEVSAATARTAPPSLRVMDRASAPAKPMWPKTKLLLAAGLGLGAFCGLGLALLLDFFNGRVTLSRLRLSPGLPSVFALHGDPASPDLITLPSANIPLDYEAPPASDLRPAP